MITESTRPIPVHVTLDGNATTEITSSLRAVECATRSVRIELQEIRGQLLCLDPMVNCLERISVSLDQIARALNGKSK